MLTKISKNKKWLLSLLLVFALSLAGWGISTLINSFIPFWLLFGFSIIYAVEKWLFYYTRKYKIVGKIYRAILNLSVLSLFGLIVWSGVSLFTKQFMQSPIVGSLIFLAELVVFIWACRVVSKNSWRWPSMKLTVFSLICLFIIFAFAGVQPLSVYKDNLLDKITSTYEDYQAERERKKQRMVSEAVDLVPATITDALPKNSTSNITIQDMDIRKSEELAFTLINMYREEQGVPPTIWDGNLYELSKAHTEEMASRGELFHGSGDVGENAWGGRGYYQYSSDDLAMAIVNGWITSPLHNAWLLHSPIKESVVSIVITSDGRYASWYFWMSKLNSGPKLVTQVYKEYENSDTNLDWISWLESKGYID